MKIIKLTVVLSLFFYIGGFAQTATLSVKLLNTDAKSFTTIHFKRALPKDFLKEGFKKTSLDVNKMSMQNFDFKEPQFIYISCYDKATKKSLRYSFYISPGDNLIFKADILKPDYAIVVSGKGSNNNQPLLNEETSFDSEAFYGDTLPFRAIAKIKEIANKNKQLFEKYKILYKPTSSLVKDLQLKLKYQPAADFYSFKENNKYQIKTVYVRTQPIWQKVQDSLFNEKTINNDEAVNVQEYLSLIKDFLLRKKESLWQESNKNPIQFYNKWYGKNIEESKKSFAEDNVNLLSEKILTHYFKGKSADYLYAVLMANAIGSSEIKNLGPIFSNYQKAYPKSEYISSLKPYIDKILQKQTLKLTSDMLFAKNEGKTLNTFEDVLALTKGKTILLDMWGTWCGPCREEIEKNGKAIKDYFHGKRLDYLYIANFDTQSEKKWKELIAYFELKGLHILANEKLTKDIMDKIRGKGYPTYVIIKKDGSYELSKAGYPMDRSILIKQLEEALSLNTGK